MQTQIQIIHQETGGEESKPKRSNKKLHAEIDVILTNIAHLDTTEEIKAAAKDLYWYDTTDKKLLHFRGTRLAFRYDTVLKKQVAYPVFESAKRQKIVNNKESILSWVSDYEEDLGVEVVDVDERSVLIEFPAYMDNRDNRERVEDALYAARFRYDIEEH